jgi:Tfp pilus assembly protein PilV
MKTAKEIADELFGRIKSNEMSFYEVKREVAHGWLPNGTVPFNVRCRNGVATFTVYASSQIDAEDQVTSWLEQDE